MSLMLCGCGNLLASSLNGGSVLFRDADYDMFEWDNNRWLEVWECEECGMLIVFKEDVNKVLKRYLPEDSEPGKLLKRLDE